MRSGQLLPRHRSLDVGRRSSASAAASPSRRPEIREFGETDRLGLRMTAVAVETKNGRVYRAPGPRRSKLPRRSRSRGTFRKFRSALQTVTSRLPVWLQYVPRPVHAAPTCHDGGVRRCSRRTYDLVLADGGSETRHERSPHGLRLILGKLAQYGSSQAMIVPYPTSTTRFNSGFARNDLPMTWDFYEANFFGDVGGDVGPVGQDCGRRRTYVGEWRWDRRPTRRRVHKASAKGPSRD